jgi:hypothetical protein
MYKWKILSGGYVNGHTQRDDEHLEALYDEDCGRVLMQVTKRDHNELFILLNDSGSTFGTGESGPFYFIDLESAKKYAETLVKNVD